MSAPAEILAARERIADTLLVTPCVPARQLSQELGAEVRIKCESLQRTGSFKPRGALNRMLQLPAEARQRGVVCASAGNHAQAVAFAAARLGAPALIVMPETTPLVKVSATRQWGAEVVLHGAGFDDATERAQGLQRERGLTYVHAFDDEQVIAGQGTVGLELLEQFPELDTVVVPIGGGGLISGIAMAIKATRPQVRIYGVQTEACLSMERSFKTGSLVADKPSPSIAEGITVKTPGGITVELVRKLVDDVVLVSEAGIEGGIYRLLETNKLLAEGAGAAALTALLERRLPDLAGRHVAVILSGGNIDLNILSRIVERALARHHRLTRLRLTIGDRPGSLAAALGIVAQSGASVLHIEHNRFFTDASFWETEIELTLETRDSQQVAELREALRAAGYSRITEPDVRLFG
ncbi:MAG TPA: threonine ammonia-lyase [Thermoanaerobaculia bacterium]|nr:threonine ammonia-lyase [Thermoanaerobaculia bacterium]